MPNKITKRAVDALQPDTGGQDAFLWDTELTGFGVRCRASGAKAYVLKYRHGGRARWITIGRHGDPWTPHTARKEAERLKGELAAGRDPAASRDQTKRAGTIAELAERFQAEYVPKRCRPSTAYEYRRNCGLFVVPGLGQLRVSEVTRADVQRWHHQLTERRGPYAANRALGVLRTMLGWAEELELRPDRSNPCIRVTRNPEKARERYLKGEELERLGRTLVEIERAGRISPYAVAAIRLLLLSGARLSEVRLLRWDWVDLEAGRLELPDSKTGAKKIQLAPAAVELLAGVERRPDSPFVFPGRAGGPLGDLKQTWRIVRRQAGLDDVRLHDLRHSFASVAAGSGLSLHLIGGLLGHSQPATTKRYAHLQDDVLREANAAVGQRIASAVQPAPKQSDPAASRVANSSCQLADLLPRSS